jgi:hypothetical protein
MSIIKTIQFRFKSPVVTTTTPPSQSLFVNISHIEEPQFSVVLEHTSSLASGSYSGSIPDPYSKYGTLKFIYEDLETSASIYLPFLDGGWWSVMVTQESNYTYTLYAANKLYDGVDGNTVGFKGSAAFTGSLDWNGAGTVYFPGSGSTTTLSKTYIPFDGQLQELRYFTETITEQQFDAYTQNPNSIEGSSDLNFRASLGGELFTQSSSIHPGVGGAVQSDSFSTGNTFTLVSGSFRPNYETILIDQVEGGVRNRVADKIKKPSLLLPFETSIFDNIPSNKVLSSQLRIQQNLQVSQSSTRDVNYAEVTLSPQNEINDDINATYGYFNIGEYIGDPREITSSLRDYPNLVGLKNSYFSKYSKNYNYKDYVRLSKYYDNAVFQMIKDFTPVRTGLATGVTVKQHLLERNRVRPAQVTLRDETLTGSIKPQSRGYEDGTIEVFSGGPGGSVNSLTGSNQAWTASYSTPAGLVTQVESSQYEFYNGEYSGSTTTAQISHSINPDPILNNVEDNRASTFYQDVDYSYNARTPVNIDLILSGSAIPAIVPDSNYTSLRSITPRYLGSKNSGELNISQSFADRSIQTGYPADRLTPWFAYFNGIYNSAELGIGIGGNINITQLINAETKDTITLTSENTNLDFIGQLFKQGDRPSIAPAALDEILEGAVELEAVGQLYQTILMKSGSAGSGARGNDYPNGALSPNYSSPTSLFNSEQFSNGIAVTQSLVALPDSLSPSFNQPMWIPYTSSQFEGNWLDVINDGANRFNLPTALQGLGNIYIYNSKTNEYTQEVVNPIEETYLPIQRGDFIRVSSTASFDTTIRVDNKQISPISSMRTISFAPNPGFTTTFRPSSSSSYPFHYSASLLELLPETEGLSDPADYSSQNFRIIRRVPTEFYILAKNKPGAYTGEGLLLPENFDPQYDARATAIKVGAISRTN